METTFPASIKLLASAPLKKNSTSGSEPVSKSVMTLVLKVSSEVADASATVLPVFSHHASTALLKFWALVSSPAKVVVTFNSTVLALSCSGAVSPDSVFAAGSLAEPVSLLPHAAKENTMADAKISDKIRLFILYSSLDFILSVCFI